LKTDRNIF